MAKARKRSRDDDKSVRPRVVRSEGAYVALISERLHTLRTQFAELHVQRPDVFARCFISRHHAELDQVVRTVQLGGQAIVADPIHCEPEAGIYARIVLVGSDGELNRDLWSDLNSDASNIASVLAFKDKASVWSGGEWPGVVYAMAMSERMLGVQTHPCDSDWAHVNDDRSERFEIEIHVRGKPMPLFRACTLVIERLLVNHQTRWIPILRTLKGLTPEGRIIDAIGTGTLQHKELANALGSKTLPGNIKSALQQLVVAEIVESTAAGYRITAPYRDLARLGPN